MDAHTGFDEATLRWALAEADIVPALLVLTHLTQDFSLLDEAAPHIKGAWSFLESVPADLKARIRDRLVDVLMSAPEAAGSQDPLSDGDIQRMMSAAVGQHVSSEYIPLLLEELRLSDPDPRAVNWRQKPDPKFLDEFKVVIVGAGFAGLCAAIRLKQMGIPFVVLEKNAEIGGTWYENTYPGVGVDTPNHFYSYSFHPYNKWPHHFSKGGEILKYIMEVAEAFDIREHIRFGVEVTDCVFNQNDDRWTVAMTTSSGSVEEMSCRVLVTAVGQLNRPSIPGIPGLTNFGGPVFHTAEWDHDADLKGKRVAMIGTGASAVQAGPSIVDDVSHLTVFQRSPHWVAHNPNYHKEVTAGQLWALENIPYFSEWARFQLFWASSDGFHASLKMDPNWAQPDISLNAANHQYRETLVAHIKRELEGREDLIAKSIPNYPPYGKRMLRDNNWLQMLRKPNVDLVNQSISRINENSIVLSDGTEIPVDVIILATGFQASRVLWPMEIVGRDGVTIRDRWGDDDPRAYLGMTVPEFPNLFVTFGPNTSLAHGGSAIFHFECQVRYICQALRSMIESRSTNIEVKRSVHDEFNERVDEKCREMVWSHTGVKSWYKNEKGRVTVTSPWRLVDYWELTRNFDENDFEIGQRPRSASAQRNIDESYLPIS